MSVLAWLGAVATFQIGTWCGLSARLAPQSYIAGGICYVSGNPAGVPAAMLATRHPLFARARRTRAKKKVLSSALTIYSNDFWHSIRGVKQGR